VGSTVHRILAAAGSDVDVVIIDDDDHIDGDLHHVLADHPKLLERFRNSRWGQRPASYAELEFTLSVNNQMIRGSIDRVDRLEDGTLEIVDFKTGKHRSSEELRSDLQLPIYALAASELLGAQPEQIRASLFFLGSDHEWILDWSGDHATDARRTITELLDTMATSSFRKTDDRSKCRHCDFAHICER
jgi:RecB family exonuclease